MDEIAVILPVYEKDNPIWLQLAIDSIINQSYKNRQIFIGVDGPVGQKLDDCLNGYAETDYIHIIRFAENRGLACVLNDLLDICFEKGYEYIARMDADDISLPDRFEKQMKFLRDNLSVDVVGGAVEEIDQNGKSRNKTILYPSSPADCRAFFAKRNPHAHPAVMFRKAFFDKSKCKYRPDYRQNQDTMLWFDGFMNDTRNANIPDVILKFRMTDSLFKKRRNGWAFAGKQLEDRKMINKKLKYGIGASLFAYAMFCMLISPAWIKKIAYKVFR